MRVPQILSRYSFTRPTRTRHTVPAIDPGGRVVDATGARDLLVAAYVWAEQKGLGPLERLQWSQVYAGLSITTALLFGLAPALRTSQAAVGDALRCHSRWQRS